MILYPLELQKSCRILEFMCRIILRLLGLCISCGVDVNPDFEMRGFTDQESCTRRPSLYSCYILY